MITFTNLTVQVGPRVAYSPIKRVRFRIIGSRHPCWTAPALPAFSFPGVVAKFSWSRRRIKSPQASSRGRIVSIDKATDPKFSSGDPGDDFILEGQRGHGRVVTILGVGHLALPEHSAAL